MTSEVAEVAEAWRKAGQSVVPAREDGSKAPLGLWKQYQNAAATEEVLHGWYRNGKQRTGLGLVTGFNNLEMLEFETANAHTEFCARAETFGHGDLVRRIEAGYSEDTPGGGVHWMYRCSAVSGSTPLAREANGKVLIETRGTRGYTIVAPSHGNVHPSGKPYVRRSGSPEKVVEIAPEERRDLFNLARSLDRKPPKPHRPQGKSGDGSGDRPGDDYNERATWPDLLEPRGWVAVSESDGQTYWRRPGKYIGVSASTNYKDSNLLWVFSTSAEPFEAQRSYDLFGAYTFLEHSGDFAQATAALAAEGYGAGTPLPPGEAGTAGAEEKVLEALGRLRIQDRARQLFNDEKAADEFTIPPSRSTLADDLAIEDPPTPYVISELHPEGSNVLLAAQFKTGKTTLALNVLRSLTDGEAFLGSYPVSMREGRVGYWNYELQESQFRNWARGMNIRHLERAAVLHLRDYQMPLRSRIGEDFAVEWLTEQDVKYWIIDPFGSAYDGNEIDNSEVRDWLKTIDVIKRRANVTGLLMPSHTGRMQHEPGQERVRGATRLDDWADVRWVYTAQEHDRFFYANGRDVEVEEFGVSYDSSTRTLTASGEGNRRQTAVENGVEAVVNVVAQNPGIAKDALTRKIRGRTQDRPSYIEEAIERGLIEVRVEGRAHRHYMVQQKKIRLSDQPKAEE